MPFTDLSEFTDVADSFALEGTEVRGDAAVLEVDNTGEGLVQQGTDGGNRELAGLGLHKRSKTPVLKPNGLTEHARRGCGSWP